MRWDGMGFAAARDGFESGGGQQGIRLDWVLVDNKCDGKGMDIMRWVNLRWDLVGLDRME